MPSLFTGAPLHRAGPVLVLASTLVAGAALVSTAPSASAATTLASDGFDRTVSSGWGAASAGGTWSVIGGTSRSVKGSAATVAGVAAGRSFYADLTSSQPADVTVRAAFTVPSGTEVYYSAEARRQANGAAYRSRARIDSSHRLHVEVVRYVGGSATVLAQKTLATVAAGKVVTVELAVSGSSTVTVKGKSYVTGTAAPDWQVSGKDTSSARLTAAGQIGVAGYVGPGNGAQTFTTQAFSASSLSTAPAAPPAPTTPTTPAATTSSTHGAASIGSTSYPVPGNAVFVSPSGSDSASGTLGSPVRTVTKALTKVKSGQTIVLRGGTYHEYFIVPPGKAVTIQNYPKEAVWFDGASKVTGFSASGSAWQVGGWTSLFDSSPTFVKGAADGTAVGSVFIDPAYPMAAHPDAVWIDGVEQKQVGSLSKVTAGAFYVDYSAKRLYLGSNPSGKTVEASTLSQAISLRAPGTTVRGIGFRRFADSVPQQGVVNTYYDNQHLENVEVRDSATGGIGIFGTGCTLKNVTIAGSGQLGLQASYADNLVVDNVSIRNSNDQNFNPTPSAGGFKITTSRNVTLKNSEISGTNGNGFWTDHSVYDVKAVNNIITGGTRWGLVLEISSTATVADNVIAGNARDGIYVVNTDKVNIWNNTLVGNGQAGIAITQDYRRIQNLAISGHDPRRAQPDLSMPWVTRNVSIGNNIMTGGSASKSTLYQAESWERAFTGDELVGYSNGNVFARTAGGVPTYAAVWGRKSAYATNYATLAAFANATGRDTASYAYTGGPVNSSYQPVAAISSRNSTTGQPLPGGVAALIGKASGTRHLGAFR